MDWKRPRPSVIHLPNLQVDAGHPVLGGPGAVHHTKHPGLHREEGDGKCLQILYLPHKQWKVENVFLVFLKAIK